MTDEIAAWSALSLVIITIFGAILSKILLVQKELTDHKTYVAERYATKTDIKDSIDSVEKQLERMNRLFESIVKVKK